MSNTGIDNKTRTGVGRALSLLLAICLTHVASASEPTSMRFDRLGMADGLSQSSVMAIAQDQSGFMWFATESGLDRFDGFTFTNYRPDRGNPESLAGDFVRDLSIAADGSLWAATDGGGLSRWDPDSDTFTTWRHDPQSNSSIASDSLRTVLADEQGFVWIGTRDSGLDRLDPDSGHVTHFRNDADDTGTISDDHIYALALDADGALWVATRQGLNRIDPATHEITRYLNEADDAASLADDWVRSLHFDAGGTLWIGTHRGGLCRLDRDTDRFTHFVTSPDDTTTLSSNRIETIYEDDEGRLWVGTSNGLNLMDREQGSFSRYNNDPTDGSSLSSDYIFSMFQDRGGMLWIGTRTSGLNKWNPRSWSFGHYKASSAEGGFSDPNITSFTQDLDRRVWVGTFGGGLNVMVPDEDSVRQMRHDPDDPRSLSDDRVMALLTDTDGKVWAGTMVGGLNRIDPATGESRHYRHDPEDASSLAADGVMALFQDAQERIWVGTFGGGVSRLDDDSGRFTNYGAEPGSPNALSSPRATSIVEDPHGVIWVGTDGGGLNWTIDGGATWHHLQHNPDDPTSLSSNTVYAMHIDRRGALWIGTRAGLDRLLGSTSDADNLRFQNVSKWHRLSSNAVYGIQSDADGKLWLSTNHGLTRYDPTTGDARRFHEAQGLQGEEFNFGASYASPEGRLFFGGSNGFNAFDPADLEFNARAPSVVLTSLSILNRPVSADTPYEHIDGLELSHRDDVVTFGIAALDFAAPENNRYAYRLEGFDDDWVEAGSEHRITYTNLDGGDYTLHVKAANSDGAWNEQGISIPIGVTPPPWKTWWAYSLYVLLMAAAAFSLWERQQKRLRREAEYSRRLEREVHSRTKLLNDRNKDLKDANKKLMDASMTDPLTGLRNRRFLYEQVTKDVDLVLRHYRDGTETIRPGGNNDLLFLMVDLDNFKPVNDNCGHEAGDELLIQIRDVLLDACRYSDDVIRWGGDEFLIVARETNRKFAATLAERIRASLSQRVFSIGNGQVARITSSIGYANYPFIKDRPDLLSWEEVLGVADAAMYEAKQRRNSWIGVEGLAWEDSGDVLYDAIRNDPGQLAKDGAIRAIESLDEAEEGYA